MCGDFSYIGGGRSFLIFRRQPTLFSLNKQINKVKHYEQIKSLKNHKLNIINQWQNKLKEIDNFKNKYLRKIFNLKITKIKPSRIACR
jgi:hypothetical protein